MPFLKKSHFHWTSIFGSYLIFFFSILTGPTSTRANPSNIQKTWRVHFDFCTSTGGMITRRSGRIVATSKANNKYLHLDSVPIEIPTQGFMASGLKRDPFVLAHQIEEALNSQEMNATQLEQLITFLQTQKDLNALDDIHLPGHSPSAPFELKTFKVQYGVSLGIGLASQKNGVNQRGFLSEKTQFVISGPGLVNDGHVFLSTELYVPFHGPGFHGPLVAQQIEDSLNEGNVSFHEIREVLSQKNLLTALDQGLKVDSLEISKNPLRQTYVRFEPDGPSGIQGFRKNGSFVIFGPNPTKPQSPLFFEGFAVEVPFSGFKFKNPHALAFAFEDALKTQKIEQAALERFLSDHNLLQKLEDGKLPENLSSSDFHTSCALDAKKFLTH